MRLPLLFLDSLAIGVVIATILIEATILLGPSGMGRFFTDLPAWVLALIWAQACMFFAPLGTLWFLFTMDRDAG